MRSRNKVEKAARRKHLLDAAQSVFSKKGFQNTSMDDIAEQAGFSRSLLYVYFKDKKDIYRSLRVRSAESLLERMQGNIENDATGLERLKQTGAAYFDFYTRDKNHFDCLSLDISLNNQSGDTVKEIKHHPESLQIEKKIMEIMVTALEDGMKDGSIDPKRVNNPWQTAMFLRGSLHGVIMLQDKDGSAALEKANLDGPELVDYTLNMTTDSLRPK